MLNVFINFKEKYPFAKQAVFIKKNLAFYFLSSTPGSNTLNKTIHLKTFSGVFSNITYHTALSSFKKQKTTLA